MTFLVQRYGAVGAAASVNYAVNNGIATQGVDFQASAGTLQFAAGETEKSFTVTVLADGLDENTELFSVAFSGASGATVADGTVTGTIIDDDDISLYVNDVSTQEGDDPGGREVRFTVTRFGETSGATSVNYATITSTASTPADLQIGTGNLAFGAGETTKQVVVRVVGDATQEAGEQYAITLSAASNGTVVGSAGQGWIIDDDESLLYANDVSVTEGTGGTTEAVFTVTRFGATDGTTTVQFATVSSTASSPNDFASSTGMLTFAPGEVTKQVPVSVATDSLQEASEAYQLDLAVPSNGTVVGGRGNGRIVDDDTSFVGVTGVTVTEGSAGATNAAFTVTRFGSTAGAASIDLRTSNSTATSPADYSQVVTTVTFVPGDNAEVVTVPVAADTSQEQNEAFTVSLVTPSNTTVLLGAQMAYIIDDDESFLYVTSAAVVEGNPGAPGSLVFTVHRLGSLAGDVSVNFAAAASSATTPADFPATSGTLPFAPGVASRTITIPAVADFIRETAEEAFLVNLSAVQNATIVNGQAQATILDDDPAPAVTRVFVSGSTWGGNDGLPNVTFKEYLASQNLGSVDYGFAISAGANQALSSPWSNVNRVSIEFSQDVVVERDDLSLRGTNVANYTFLAGEEGFRYDAAARTATWILDRNLLRDRLLIDLDAGAPNGVRNAGGEFLDGEWNNGADDFPSGNGLGGGDFLFRINALRGDASRDTQGRVNSNDAGYVKSRLNRSTNSPISPSGGSSYAPYADINTDGRVNSNDQGFVKSNLNSALPVALPSGVAGPGLFGELKIEDADHLRSLLA
jgi:hypothetical protein